MSYLKFERFGHLQLYSSANAFLGSWPALDDTAARSSGAWPGGRYPWSHYNPHPYMGGAPSCISTANGCEGIHVFDVADHGRNSMGVHAGRVRAPDAWGLSLGSKTLGCVRTSEDAMRTINSTHAADPLTHIEITSGWFAHKPGQVA